MQTFIPQKPHQRAQLHIYFTHEDGEQKGVHDVEFFETEEEAVSFFKDTKVIIDYVEWVVDYGSFNMWLLESLLAEMDVMESRLVLMRIETWDEINNIWIRDSFTTRCPRHLEKMVNKPHVRLTSWQKRIVPKPPRFPKGTTPRGARQFR